MYRKVYNFLIDTDQIYVSQYGCRSGHSCEHAVSELTSAVLNEFQKNEFNLGLFLDLFRLFDTLDHKIYGIWYMVSEG